MHRKDILPAVFIHTTQYYLTVWRSLSWHAWSGEPRCTPGSTWCTHLPSRPLCNRGSVFIRTRVSIIIVLWLISRMKLKCRYRECLPSRVLLTLNLIFLVRRGHVYLVDPKYRGFSIIPQIVHNRTLHKIDKTSRSPCKVTGYERVLSFFWAWWEESPSTFDNKLVNKNIDQNPHPLSPSFFFFSSWSELLSACKPSSRQLRERYKV